MPRTVKERAFDSPDEMLSGLTDSNGVMKGEKPEELLHLAFFFFTAPCQGPDDLYYTTYRHVRTFKALITASFQPRGPIPFVR